MRTGPGSWRGLIDPVSEVSPRSVCPWLALCASWGAELGSPRAGRRRNTERAAQGSAEPRWACIVESVDARSGRSSSTRRRTRRRRLAMPGTRRRPPSPPRLSSECNSERTTGSAAARARRRWASHRGRAPRPRGSTFGRGRPALEAASLGETPPGHETAPPRSTPPSNRGAGVGARPRIARAPLEEHTKDTKSTALIALCPSCSSCVLRRPRSGRSTTPSPRPFRPCGSRPRRGRERVGASRG